jgi:UDP-glucose 4-epimerase
MRILVTGVAGFLGSHLAEELTIAGHTVIGVDNLLGGEFANVPAGVSLHVLDCGNWEQLQSIMRDVEIVYHLAAAPHEGLSVFSPGLINQHTYRSTIGVTIAALNCGVRRIVFTSSMARYGDQHGAWCTEAMVPRPCDPYGVAKWASEEALRCLSAAHGIEYVVAVPHNIIGTRQKYNDPFRNVVAIMINRMLQGKQPIIYGDGTQTRSFSFVTDCTGPLIQMATAPVHGEVINIGPDDIATSINELAMVLAELCEFNLNPIYVPDRPMEVKHALVSADKARTLLGYRPETDLRAGLAEIVTWMRARGPRPFVYHLPIEIESNKLPITWREHLL